MARTANPDDFGELLSITDAAAILGVHPDTARRYARQGTIRARKLPHTNRHYLLKQELLDFLKTQPLVGELPDGSETNSSARPDRD